MAAPKVVTQLPMVKRVTLKKKVIFNHIEIDSGLSLQEAGHVSVSVPEIAPGEGMFNRIKNNIGSGNADELEQFLYPLDCRGGRSFAVGAGLVMNLVHIPIITL